MLAVGGAKSPSDANKIPRPPSAGAAVLQAARNKPLEHRLGSYGEGLSYSGSLLCGVNYLLSLAFWCFLFFFVPWDYFLANKASF